MALRQKNRLLTLKSPLGDDVLVLTAFSGQEEISRLFNYELEMISDNNSISASEIVGKNVTFGIKLADGSVRHFNGFVTRFVAGDEDGQRRRNYRAEVAPWLWFLTRTSDCRIFQEKSVPEIIEQVFKDLNFSDYDVSQVSGEHPKRDYCVQYRETDFNFVSRLMEEEGIFYFFRHEEGKHTLVMADQKGAYKDCVEKEVDYPRDHRARAITDHITEWEHQYEFHTGKWSQTDYNFEDHPARSEPTPSKLMMTSEQSTTQLDGVEKYEFYDYPGEYDKKDAGKTLTKVRIEEEEAGHDTIRAGSTCRSFTPGGKFKVKDHRSDAEKGKTFAITSIHHWATESTTYETGGSVEEDYRNTFLCIPDSVTFRPRRITPKPVVQGSQTAVVDGPEGEEIWPDKYGRIKVQFFWDREGQRNEKTSCWVRCMQSSAGKGWGSMFIPRVGQEVVVSYLEGDPDRPLVTGVVYNADQMPAYPLPQEKTKSYVKTNSSPDGDGYNELRFEDKKDKEQIFIHAQRDMDTRVLNDSKERIFGSRHQVFGCEKDGSKGGDQREMVYQDKHLTVHRNQTEHVGGDMQLLVGGIEGEGNQEIVVQGDRKESVGKNQHIHVKNDRNESVDGSQSLTVGMDQQEKVGMKHAVEAGQEIHLKAGMKVVIEAGLQLTIKAAGGFIDIGPAGVTIQGTLVNINSGGAAGTGGGSSPASPEAPQEAAPTAPAEADDSKTGQKSAPD